ncbi:MAG TPA: hypothetical protein HPQ00_12105, partial [Magnetococcales bacterium]|nr:hypothetical protein [Magnetococcales bacterium]
KLKRILLVAGRYLQENPYREVHLKRLFEARGVEVALAIPGRGINKGGFTPESRNDPVFEREKALWVDGHWDFQAAMRGCQAVVLSTWRSYDPLADMARHKGLPTINFAATSGQDHWPNNVDHCLVRSRMAISLLNYLCRTGQVEGCVPESRMSIVGSMLHESPDGMVSRPTMDREFFCQRYGLDPSRRIVVLFPAGVAPYRVKVPLWRPEWSPSQVDEYIRKMIGEYFLICKTVRDAGCNLLIKLHPTAYASYWCREGEEADFWSQNAETSLLAPQDTQAMFRHMDIGVGINTNASMDAGYFNKPFIYISPDSVPLGPSIATVSEIEACCGIPLGPSSHWYTRPKTSPTPWMSSWLGHFCTMEQLSELLNDPQTYTIDPSHAQSYITEFWHRNDQQTGLRIVNASLEIFESALANSDFPTKIRRLRHAIDLNYLRAGIQKII